MGVDAALDFPLFFRLPAVAKGSLAPSELVAMFERRKAVEREVLSSHGEASRYFVTFLDNHDQRSRIFLQPERSASTLRRSGHDGHRAAVHAAGIPCLYYGTEQALHGSVTRGRGGPRGVVGQDRSLRPRAPVLPCRRDLVRHPPGRRRAALWPAMLPANLG